MEISPRRVRNTVPLTPKMSPMSHLSEIRIGLFADVVNFDIDLDFSVPVHQIGKGGLAHFPAQHHAACNGNLFSLHGLEVVDNLGGVGSADIFDQLKGVFAGCLQLAQLVTANLQNLVERLLFGRGVLFSSIFVHPFNKHQMSGD